MATFKLVFTLSTDAFTTVEAGSLEEAIDIALDREVWMEVGDRNVCWVADGIRDEGPNNIREEGRDRAPVEMPILHVGGTGVDRLLADYTNAVNSIRGALRDLPEPCERDYTRSPYSFECAMVDHRRRVAALQGMLDDFQAVLESIADQRDSAAR